MKTADLSQVTVHCSIMLKLFYEIYMLGSLFLICVDTHELNEFVSSNAPQSTHPLGSQPVPRHRSFHIAILLEPIVSFGWRLPDWNRLDPVSSWRHQGSRQKLPKLPRQNRRNSDSEQSEPANGCLKGQESQRTPVFENSCLGELPKQVPSKPRKSLARLDLLFLLQAI